jgi:hypothetical protein
MVSLRDLVSLHDLAGPLTVPLFTAASIVDHLFDEERDFLLTPFLWFIHYRFPEPALAAMAELLVGCFIVVTIVGLIVFFVTLTILALDHGIARLPVFSHFIVLPIWVGVTCITAGLFAIEAVIPALPPPPLNPFWHLELLCYGILIIQLGATYSQ